MPRCDHIAIRVHDIEESIRFYETMLPGRVVRRKEGLDRYRTRIAYVQPEGQTDFAIVLIQPSRVRWVLAVAHRLFPRQFRSFEHFGLACESRDAVDARYRVALANGFRVSDRPAYIDDVVGYVFEVRDPDGNAVEWTHGKRIS